MYYTDPESYLTRAEEQLASGDIASLFYAAFELRCAVECRQHEYLEAQESYRKSLPRSWKIGQQGKELQRIYERPEIQALNCKFKDGSNFIYTYVPVSEALRGDAERFGNLLHAPSQERGQSELEKIRSGLDLTAARLKECLSGNLLSPVLLDPKTGQPLIGLIVKISKQERGIYDKMSIGEELVVEVRYDELTH
ncbi:MAG: hypothetical protein COB16_02075 [Rhodobacteraceae bacterium]|nr:MAG: hypothetical protein COB16_02075 [Paracoccaceae bacterium]